jgi:4a-hydroxytetrahydrobiopterin dehydratase
MERSESAPVDRYLLCAFFNLSSHNFAICIAVRPDAVPATYTTQDITGRNAITKTYHFVDFVQAMQWMNQVADVAEMMQHHPEWSNIYNTVNVTLTTHDCGGVSQRVRVCVPAFSEIGTLPHATSCRAKERTIGH